MLCPPRRRARRRSAQPASAARPSLDRQHGHQATDPRRLGSWVAPSGLLAGGIPSLSRQLGSSSPSCRGRPRGSDPVPSRWSRKAVVELDNWVLRTRHCHLARRALSPDNIPLGKGAADLVIGPRRRAIIQGWPDSSEQVAGLIRNGWPDCLGIRTTAGMSPCEKTIRSRFGSFRAAIATALVDARHRER